jgi:DNA-binding protein HU-beta
MTKAQFTAKLADKLKMKKAETGRIVEEFTEMVIGAMKKGDRVRFPGFGTFKVSKRKARIARNPQTGEPVRVPARTVPRFTPAKELKELVKRA